MGEHIEFILIAVAVLLALLFVKKSLVIIPQSETKIIERLGKLLNGIGKVVDFVNSLEGVYYLEVEQGIDLHLNVIFGDNVLLVKVVHLLTKVNRARIQIATIGHRHDGFRTIHEGDDNVDTRFEYCTKLTQTFDDFRFRLGYNDK